VPLRAVASRAVLAGCVLLLAGVASAARVTDVRVGRHDEFTRVVFELDQPAGYKIERAEPSPGVSELVVSLDAAASPRSLSTDGPRVRGVEVEPTRGSRSRARIRLGGGGLRLKEMILTGPPRIVLDVMGPEEEEPPPQQARAEPPEAPSEPEPEPEPEPPAREVERPESAAGPPREELADGPDAEEGASELEDMAAAEPPHDLPEDDLDAGPAGEEPGAGEPEEEAFGGGSGQPEELAAPPGEIEEPDEPALAPPGEIDPARPGVPPAPRPPPESRTDRPAAGERASAPAGGGLDWRSWAAVGGVVLLLAVVFLWLRRRRAAAGTDEEAYAEAEPNPFADGEGFAEDETFGDEEPGPGPELEEPRPAPAFEDDTAPEPAREQGAAMETTREETGFDVSAGAAAAGAGEDVMRLVRELERRVASLETRLDEVVDAKERLERQVAAQTEELRVQRAAIARTQRAVRSLSRPEDESAATEPAPREG